MSCDLAETCVFVKQSLEPGHCDPVQDRRYSLTLSGHPFSQSYGVRLPSSLTRVLSRAWVSSTRLPVSVCGTVGASLARGFSRRPFSLVRVRNYPFASPPAASYETDLPISPRCRLDPDNQSRAKRARTRPPIADNDRHRCRNINRPAIGFPIRVHLRTD